MQFDGRGFARLNARLPGRGLQRLDCNENCTTLSKRQREMAKHGDNGKDCWGLNVLDLIGSPNSQELITFRLANWRVERIHPLGNRCQ